jgi:hypothetical protein
VPPVDPTVPVLVVERPAVGTLEHPLPPGADIAGVVARLAAVVPTPATWSIRVPTGGKVANADHPASPEETPA